MIHSFMDELAKLGPLLSAVVLFFGFVIGLLQYRKQQKFKRIQNLQSVWKNFVEDDELLDLYSWLDDMEDKKNIQKIIRCKNRVKFKWLGLLEEVAMFCEEFEIDEQYAIYLFQSHFYYTFRNKDTKTPFWQNLGGIQEVEKTYWQKSRHFSVKCEKSFLS